MTTERWDDARLDRLASSVEALSSRMNDFAERETRLASTVEALSSRMNDFAERETRLASTVETLSSRMNELAERDIQLASVVGTTSLRVNDLQESIDQTTHNLDILVGAVNALIERDNERRLEIERSRQEAEAYRRENDQRFTILLEEIRFLIRRLGNERGD